MQAFTRGEWRATPWNNGKLLGRLGRVRIVLETDTSEDRP